MALRLGFEKFPASWRVYAMDSRVYNVQKSILINNGSPQDHHDAHLATNIGVKDVWRNVYLPRLQRLSGNKNVSPIVFPGPAPILDSAFGAENFAFDRLKTFSAHKFLRAIEVSCQQHRKHLKPCRWQLEGLNFDTFQQLHALPNDERQADLPDLQGRTILDRDSLIDVFNCIHKLWSPVPELLYDHEAVSTAFDYLNQVDCPSIECLFELEEFASYCTLRRELRIVASGIYFGKWVDIGAMPVGSLRGTERFRPERLQQELQNVADGRIAPLVVNEFGCVADGNHRLAAAWIWNMLHHCQHYDWQADCAEFETALQGVAQLCLSADNSFSVANAIDGLSTLLDDLQGASLLNQLRKEISSKKIEALPVVPMLSYNSFALDRAAFEDNGALMRFDPVIYAVLAENPLTFLPPRACFHFADRVPLPWFAVLSDAEVANSQRFFRHRITKVAAQGCRTKARVRRA